MPLHNICVVEVFYCWSVDFMGSFPPSSSFHYILMVVDYVLKWVEAIPCKANNHNKAMKENIYWGSMRRFTY